MQTMKEQQWWKSICIYTKTYQHNQGKEGVTNISYHTKTNILYWKKWWREALGKQEQGSDLQGQVSTRHWQAGQKKLSYQGNHFGSKMQLSSERRNIEFRRAYLDQHKRLHLADVIADSSKQKFLFICLSVGLSATNSRMPIFQLDRKRQLGGDFVCVETLLLLFLNVPPQNPCLNLLFSFLFVSKDYFSEP